MHHRCFHFDVASPVEKLPQLLDDPRTRHEHLPRLLVGDQIKVPLPVTKLDVRQPVPLLRQRQQRFGEEEQFLDPDGQLLSFRSKHVAAHSNRITQIQQVKQLKTALADNVLLYIHLDATSRSLQVGESGLAHQPERYDPSGHAHFALVSLQCRSGRLAILLHQRRRRIRPAKLPRIRIVPQRRDLLELLLALFELVPRLKLQLEILSEWSAREYNGPRGGRARKRRILTAPGRNSLSPILIGRHPFPFWESFCLIPLLFCYNPQSVPGRTSRERRRPLLLNPPDVCRKRLARLVASRAGKSFPLPRSATRVQLHDVERL